LFLFINNHLKNFEMDVIEKNTYVEEEIGKLKQKFARLMEDDLLYEEGRREEMWARYQSSIEQTRKELEKIVSSL